MRGFRALASALLGWAVRSESRRANGGVGIDQGERMELISAWLPRPCSLLLRYTAVLITCDRMEPYVSHESEWL